MYQHIVIPVALDHESLAERKLALARYLLSRDGRITLLTVLESIPGFVAEFTGDAPAVHLTERVEEKLRELAGDATDVMVKVEIGKPGLKIAEFAEQAGADLIIVGSHSPGLQDYFLGSTAARVARRAPCSVQILR